MPRAQTKRLTLTSGRIGVIADTHGLLRPEALRALKNSELIIHAGDIGKPEVLEALGAVAPVLAIRGNNDRGSWAVDIPELLDLHVNGVKIHVIHNVNELASDIAHRFQAVVSGHSHKPSLNKRGDTLFLNPGSAGPRRFKLPVAVARVQIDGAEVRAKINILEV
jgi:putative phosphoesterase